MNNKLTLAILSVLAGLGAFVAVLALREPPPATGTPATAAPAQPAAPATARGNPRNDKQILVRGWRRDELEDIVRTFTRLYDVPPGYRLEADGEALRVSFPGDVDADLFCYLVNYIQYPKNHDVAHRDIAVLGFATLTADFHDLDPALVGQPARIYVPADDRDYDRVYLHVEPDRNFVYVLSGAGWAPATSERRPPAVASLWTRAAPTSTPGK